MRATNCGSVAAARQLLLASILAGAVSAQSAPGRRAVVTSAEQRLKELGITLPPPPEAFGTYAEAVQTGALLFMTGMLPTEGRRAIFVGRVGAGVHVAAGRKTAPPPGVEDPAGARR